MASFLIQSGSRAIWFFSLSPSQYGNKYLQISLSVLDIIIPVMLYGLLTYWLSPVHVEHRRRKKGLCINCGYNLTGNLSGICPECGERI